MRITNTILFFCLFIFSCTQNEYEVNRGIKTPIVIEKADNKPDVTSYNQTLIEHKLLTQLHRWLQYYENGMLTIDNQLDLFTNNIHIKSSLGESKGKAEYSKRVKVIPPDWQNAHHVQNVKINTSNSTVTMDVIYQNKKAPNKKTASSALQYNIQYQNGNPTLPFFNAIEIEQKEVINDPEFLQFKDAYPENRVKSLAHYWLALVESNNGKVLPFQEILDSPFELNFPSGKITDFEGLKVWYKNAAQKVSRSSHYIESFEVQKTGNKTYKVVMEMEWEGLSVQNKEMEARTKHVWDVIDNPAERFARIRSITVDVLKPFQIRK